MITVYSASAGSGKTYTLTREYLQLALADNYKFAYKHILAVTFTNKATGEMKMRIVKELAKIKEGKESSIGNEICTNLQISEDILKIRAKFVLSSILHNYSSFSISTIDSFFQKVVRNFTREAGIQTGYKIELDINYVLDAVTQQVLGKLGAPGNSELDKWVIRMAEEKVEQGDKWDFRQEMIELGKELFRETLMRQEDALEELHSNSETFRRNKDKLSTDIAIRQEKAKKTAAEIIANMNKLGISQTDFAFAGSSSLADYLHAVAEGNIMLPGTRPSQMIEFPEKCFAKTNKQRNAFIPLMEQNIIPTVIEFVSWLKENISFIISATEIYRNLNILGLIGSIREELKIFREEENLLLLPDTTLLLFKIMQNNDSSFIYEKVGNYYKNYLIDEFQDTSKTQWENFKPLIINSLASGEKSLIVGDVKQSIYRWRDGDWRLLYGEFKNGIHPDLIQTKNLEHNYRSLPSVIESNNTLFSYMPQIVAQEVGERIADSEKNKTIWLEQIKGLFNNSIQKIPEFKSNEKTGYCEFNCIEITEIKEYNKTIEEEEEKQDWKILALQKLYEQINYFQSQGFPLSSMAILTRTKKDGTEILNYLEDSDSGRKPISVSSSEALSLNSGKSVQLLIYALKILLNEHNDPAKAAFSILWKYENQEQEWPKAWLNQNSEIFPRELINPAERTRLRKLPLFELFNELIRILKLNTTAWKQEAGFITGFLDAILEFLKEENPDPERFLEWWENFGKKRPIQMSELENSIRILTIHKSKGLEFPIVFIPFCDWAVLPAAINAPWLWCNPLQVGVNPLQLAPLKYSSKLTESKFSENYYEELQLNFADNLNLTYVAFTRPIQALCVSIPVHRKKDGLSMGRISSLIYKSLERASQDETIIKKEDWGFTSGEINTITKFEIKRIETPNNITIRSDAWMTRLQVKKIARKLPNTTIDKKKIEYGIILHTLLALIKTKEDTAAAIDKMIYEGYISITEKAIIEDKLNALFANTQINEWFSPKYSVRTEATILGKAGENSRPDRIMIDNQRIIILDFKTGKIRKQDQQQILGYASLLQEMGYQEIEAWLLYLSDETPEIIQAL